LHIDNIVNDYDLMHSEILCLQETQTNLDLKQSILAEKYKCVSSLHLHDVSTCCKKIIDIHKQKIYATKHIESIGIYIEINNAMVKLENIYSVPCVPLDDVLCLIQTITKDMNTL